MPARALAGFQWLPLKLDGWIGLPGSIREHQAVGSRPGSLLQLDGEQFSEEGGQRDPPPSRRGLGRLSHPGAVKDHELLDHRDGRRGQVDTAAAEADQLPPAHSRVGGGVDERAELLWQLLGHPPHLLGIEEAHLGGLDPGATEPDTGRPGQELVLDGDVQHPAKRAEVPMDRAGRQPLAKLVVDPGADVQLADLAHGQVAESGKHVPTQVALVGGSGARVEVMGGMEELLDPVGQLRGPQCRVDPLAPLHVGPDTVQESLRLRLGVERPATAPSRRIAVPRSPALGVGLLDGCHGRLPTTGDDRAVSLYGRRTRVSRVWSTQARNAW